MTGISCYSIDFNLINSKSSTMITGHAKRILINNMQVQECQNSYGGFINEMRCFLIFSIYTGWHRKLKPFNDSTGLHNHQHQKVRNALVMPNT